MRFSEIIKMDISLLQPGVYTMELIQTRLLPSGFAMGVPCSSPMQLWTPVFTLTPAKMCALECVSLAHLLRHMQEEWTLHYDLLKPVLL